MSQGFKLLDLEITSNIKEVERVIRLASDLCETLGFPDPVCRFNVPVALSEAVSNAIMRGNREHPDKTVTVTAFFNAPHLIFDVGDEGDGFDLHESVSDPTLEDTLLLEGGRGLFLMTRLLDRIEQLTIDRRNIRRNIVRLIVDHPGSAS